MKAFIRLFTISASAILAAASALAVNAPAQPPTPAPANPPAYIPKDPGAAALGDVNKLLDAKVDDGVVIAYIHNSHVNFQLSASDIIALKDRGASPEVLRALVESQASAAAAMTAQVSPQQVATVEGPMTQGGGDYSQTAPGSSYPDYGYGYGSPYYYPYYYPGYAYYNYGWPYFYFSPFFASSFTHFHHFHDGHVDNHFNHVSHFSTHSGSGLVVTHAGTTSFHSSGGGFHGGGGGGHR